MFSVSKRVRNKWIAAMNELNRGQGEVLDCLAGRAQFRWTQGAITALSVAAGLMILLFALTKQIAIPGGLFVIYFINSVRPPRVVALTGTEVLVAQRSFWNSKPTKIVARAPFAAAGHRSDTRTLSIGEEQITFNAKEHARLQAIVEASRA